MSYSTTFAVNEWQKLFESDEYEARVAAAYTEEIRRLRAEGRRMAAQKASEEYVPSYSEAKAEEEE